MYCKILSKVIKEAKRNNYNGQIIESNNKIKTAREIVKVESGKDSINEGVRKGHCAPLRVHLMNISFLWLRKYLL
jgi:hypothetical protein